MLQNSSKCLCHRGFANVGLFWLIGCISIGGWLLSVGLREHTVDAPKAMSVADTVGGSTPRYVTKNIEEVQIGDCVLAKDPGDSSPPTPHKVIALPRNWTEHIVHVRVKNGGELQATRMHPFWVEGKGWTTAVDLKPGDRLQDEKDRPITVVGVQVEDRNANTFNLTVEGVHTYYVMAGVAPVLVHNNSIPLLPASGQGMSAVNIGGEGEVPGVLNVQPGTAWNNPSWKSAGFQDPATGEFTGGGLTIEELQNQGIPFISYNPGGPLPFADNSFDQVITNSAPIDLNIGATPGIDSDEISRILNPGGSWWNNGSNIFTKPCP